MVLIELDQVRLHTEERARRPYLCCSRVRSLTASCPPLRLHLRNRGSLLEYLPSSCFSLKLLACVFSTVFSQLSTIGDQNPPQKPQCLRATGKGLPRIFMIFLEL